MDLTDNNGRTALHLACINGHIEVVATLVGYGANVTIVDKEGKILNLTKRQEKIVRILSEGELSRIKLMKAMATRIAPRTMQVELAKLEELGLIELVGEGRAAVWRVVNNRA